MHLVRSFLLLTALVAAAGAQPAPSPSPEPDLAAGDEFADAQIEEPIVGAATIIDHTGGKLTTPDGTVEVDWEPDPAREPQIARVWSIAAPGGVGFLVSGPPGPGRLRCWPPGSERSPGAAGVGEPLPPATPSAPAAADGGVEILGPDQEWTTVKNTLNPDGSRTIEFVDERKPLRKKGLVKSSSGPYVIVPDKTTVLRGQNKRLKLVNKKKQQDEWKDAVKGAALDDDELAPLPPRKGAGTASEPEDELAPLAKTPPKTGTSANDAEDDLAPLAPRKDAGTAPPTKVPGKTGDPEIDELAAPAPSGTPAPKKP